MSLAQLHTLLQRTGLAEYKADLVHNYTNGRTRSSREMNRTELRGLINHLLTLLPADQQQPKPMITDQAADRQRKKIIAMCREMGMEVMVNGQRKADMNAIHALVLNKGYLHKPFNKYTAGELPKLVSQFQNIHASHLKRKQ